MTVERLEIGAELVSRLVAGQFPRWRDLPVRPVSKAGWDNATFRLGEEMAVRLPSAERYAPQVEKEQTWLPRLAPGLPLPIPTPLAFGAPAEGYPFCWSVVRWLPGETAEATPPIDLPRFAADLARFLAALHAIDASDGPAAGPHSFFRGGPLATYDAQTRRAVTKLEDEIDAKACLDVWGSALAASWSGPPVWVHGDFAATNLLVDDGRLSGVIDFGCSAVGDPACDLAIAWTLLDDAAREVFRNDLPLDAGTWARGRGWTLWKALIVLAEPTNAAVHDCKLRRRDLDRVLSDHLAFGGRRSGAS
jgi:aminoglycoside phosphotransferase (APT) family kinase protein